LIDEPGNGGANGIIRSIAFFGNYLLVEVVVDNDVIFVQTNNESLKQGQAVSLKAKKIHILA
jgi:hypothetical protein